MSALLAWALLLALDGGVARPAPQPALSAEDEEVVQNLELLEDLEAAGDLDLLQELSVER
jgi:hypothetical protein